MRARQLLTSGLVIAAAAGGVTACSSSGGDSGADGRITVVASTDVWGDVVHQIGGDAVDVTSIITDPAADPHSYEADAQVRLELSRASLVVENGGGYDDFVDQLLNATRSGGDSPTVLNAVEISGRQASAGEELNEHVWYDFPTVSAVAGRIGAALRSADPDRAATFAANEQAFDAKLATLEATEVTIRTKANGAGAAITEPVPLYLLDACGFTNETPPAFSEAVEEGTDVAPAVLNETLKLFDDKQVVLLAYNEQTSGAETERVEQAAQDNGIAVVGVTETLPAGQDYVQWMTANLTAVGATVGA